MDKVELVTNALRDALTAYEKLQGADARGDRFRKTEVGITPDRMVRRNG